MPPTIGDDDFRRQSCKLGDEIFRQPFFGRTSRRGQNDVNDTAFDGRVFLRDNFARPEHGRLLGQQRLIANHLLHVISHHFDLHFIRQTMLAQHLWHKTVLSGLSWVVLAVLLFGRWRWGWRGPRAVKLTLTAMGLLLLAYFGSKYVLGLLGRA